MRLCYREGLAQRHLKKGRVGFVAYDCFLFFCVVIIELIRFTNDVSLAAVLWRNEYSAKVI